MNNRYNLIDEPWIPIIGGEKISLQRLFSSFDHKELGGNPIQKIALLKLLIAISQAASTPENNEDWRTMGPEGLASMCLEYLQKWRDSFWLYGEKPFLQMPAISKAEKKCYGAVLPEIATGNTTIITQSQVEKPLGDDQKALLIVTLMGFALGGKKTDNTISLSKDYKKSPTGQSGALIGYKGYLHNFAYGDNLLTTIWLNILTHENIRGLNYSNGLGTPPWESLIEGEDCEIAKALKNSLFGRLVPFSRFCLLADDGIHYSQGLSHLSHNDGGIDPSVCINRQAKDAKAIWVDPTKRPWRWLTSILSFISNRHNSGWNCPQIKHSFERMASECLGIWSGGLKVSSNAGEQYVSGIDDFVESSINLQVDKGSIWFALFEREMLFLDAIADQIRKNISAYFKLLKLDAKDRVQEAVNVFWQICEQKASKMIAVCRSAEKEKIEELRKIFKAIANQVYDSTCPRETSRQLDAWARCRLNLCKIH